MSDVSERQPEPGDAQRARRPRSLRNSAAATEPPALADTAAGESAGELADATGNAAGPAATVPDAGSPLNAILQRLGLSQAEALVRRRPEVGLGIAFAGGLVVATILKRLGRR